ncbi:hypothetical protein F4820DRAFT_416200 [Hypoxylon rubiginosum]|uniref:Uncharacterized protein n=1 Tax=Hypoxylon rubiginosum TaxID=110542 RepID=A0ACB9Z566_9PEZI|nr:hypothetical protein F4820DRAFT_416200 [Hypoxylon rubiginosum]
MTGEVAPNEDVEMGGTAEGPGGNTSGHNGNAHGPVTSTPELPEQSNPALIKSDIDEKHQHTSPPSASSVKMKPATKKKGTAAKKGPRKARTTKSKASSKKDTSLTGAAAAAGENEASSDDETDNGPYCICRGPDDHRWMISCDACEDWFHGECVKLDKETGEKLVERFVCPNCTDGKQNYTKYKKTCSLTGCKNPARMYTKSLKDRSVFCCSDHCDAWWISIINTLPTKTAAAKAAEVLTQEDFVGLLIATAEQINSDWKLGDQPFGNMDGLWSNGLPTRPGVLSNEEQTFLQNSAAERLALGNEVVQYKKMMQLVDWANQRRQQAIEAGRFTKDSCGYDWRLDTVSARHQFAEFLETPDGQAVFKAGKLDTPLPPPPGDAAPAPAPEPQGDPAIRGMCEKKRCKPHNGWYKLLMSAVRVLMKETAAAAADKLNAEDIMRHEAEARFERRELENNSVEVLMGDGC